MLLLFCAALLLCIISGKSVIYALAAGLMLFLAYGRSRGFSASELADMCREGVWKSRNVLLNFLLIGMLTGTWRGAGTIAVIVSSCSVIIQPAVFLPATFILNCGVSFLTGTCFGTSATMGVICMTMAGAMDINPALAGGAVLSGCYFGDRISPVSTSALLVGELTGTAIFDNIRLMAKSCAVPAVLTLGIYGFTGLFIHHSSAAVDLKAIFARDFSMSWFSLIPAVLLMILALMRFKVRIAMGVSIASAAAICFIAEHRALGDILGIMWGGYRSEDPKLASMMNGGGVKSMVKLMCILALASAFSGIFEKTGMLDGLRGLIGGLARVVTPFGAAFLTSLLASAVACNQTLAIILTHQLTTNLFDSKAEKVLSLEDTAVVTALYWPWSIACATPVASCGAPMTAVLCSFYVFILPLYRWAVSLLQKKSPRSAQVL